MSDTPKTDAAAWVETNQENALVLASFARELERQNRELLTVLKQIVSSVPFHHSHEQVKQNALAAIAKAES